MTIVCDVNQASIVFISDGFLIWVDVDGLSPCFINFGQGAAQIFITFMFQKIV